MKVERLEEEKENESRDQKKKRKMKEERLEEEKKNERREIRRRKGK